MIATAVIAAAEVTAAEVAASEAAEAAANKVSSIVSCYYNYLLSRRLGGSCFKLDYCYH